MTFMKSLLIVLLSYSVGFAAFTEFYCNFSTGANINSGSTESATPDYTATNGNWDATTGIFTPASGNPDTTVDPGMWASVYVDGATTAVFVGRVTGVTATTVTVSLTDKSGTAPTTSATARSITVGGCWKGPNAGEDFPFGFVQSTMKNSATNPPRVNFKNTATYTITDAIVGDDVGPIWWEGYTTTAGDGGRATFDGTITGASYAILAFTGTNNVVGSIIFANNGTTGSSGMVNLGAQECMAFNCVAHDSMGSGFVGTTRCQYIECEAYECNQANVANLAGFDNISADSVFIRCISHHNDAGGNGRGFVCSQAIDCIAFLNGSDGFRGGAANSNFLKNCDSYDNTGDGFEFSQTAANYIENCSACNNGGWGINVSATSLGRIMNCAFGSGTEDNDLGTITVGAASSYVEVGTLTYASGATPWQAPSTGNFTLTGTAAATAKNAGRGSFTQTAPSFSGTIGYPDVGAAPANNPAGNTIDPLTSTIPGL